MSKRKIRSLKAIEDYTETTMRPCQTCHSLICVGDPAVLVVYIADPKFKTGLDELDKESEEDGSYLFHHDCRDCGEIAKVKYNVSYRDQVEYVKSIILAEGDRHTADCPFCGGKNKFTLDKFDGKLIWNCYRASCGVKGAYSGKRDINAAKSYLQGNATQRFKAKYKEIPTLTTRVNNHEPAVSYLKHVNSYDAYLRGDIKIKYAPKEDRVLFYNSLGTGAVGRSLRPVRAKWWSYGDLSEGIHVGTGKHAVLVEDVASACSVSNCVNMTAVALLGTNITKSIAKTLNKYERITLVLDNDASLKAISLSRKLNMQCNVRFTKLDLKYLTAQAIEDLVM